VVKRIVIAMLILTGLAMAQDSAKIICVHSMTLFNTQEDLDAANALVIEQFQKQGFKASVCNSTKHEMFEVWYQYQVVRTDGPTHYSVTTAPRYGNTTDVTVQETTSQSTQYFWNFDFATYGEVTSTCHGRAFFGKYNGLKGSTKECAKERSKQFKQK